MTRFAIYANLTEASGADARRIKTSIRDRINNEGGMVTSIYRNPRSPDGHAYRFLRVHYEQGTPNS
jgi:hypothetical protein